MKSDDVIPLYLRVRQMLSEKGVSQNAFELDTGICRRVLYPHKHQPHRSTLMALAYYFGVTVEELVEGTDAVDIWHR